jgi:hypothetical protein
MSVLQIRTIFLPNPDLDANFEKGWDSDAAPYLNTFSVKFLLEILLAEI